MPCLPVQALALPEFTTTACAACRLFHAGHANFDRRGADLVGGEHAGDGGGVSETMSARSRFWPLLEPLPVPRRLMSQNTPLAEKPLGATMAAGNFFEHFFHFVKLRAGKFAKT
jgi:hypothetical protein